MATSGPTNCLGSPKAHARIASAPQEPTTHSAIESSQEASPSAPSPGAIVPTEAVDLGRTYSLVAIVQGFIPINIETVIGIDRVRAGRFRPYHSRFLATSNYLNWFVEDQRPPSTSQRSDRQGDSTANPCKSWIPPPDDRSPRKSTAKFCVYGTPGPLQSLWPIRSLQKR